MLFNIVHSLLSPAITFYLTYITPFVEESVSDVLMYFKIVNSLLSPHLIDQYYYLRLWRRVQMTIWMYFQTINFCSSPQLLSDLTTITLIVEENLRDILMYFKIDHSLLSPQLLSDLTTITPSVEESVSDVFMYFDIAHLLSPIVTFCRRGCFWGFW